MKRALLLTLICFLVLLAVGCRVVAGESYVLRSGETLNSDLTVAGGDARLEPGSRVAGSLFITGGSTDANGQIDGDVSVTGGNINAYGQIGGNVHISGGSINFGSGAVVRGAVYRTGGGVNITPGAQVRYAQPSGTRVTLGATGNVLLAVGLIPLLVIVGVLLLVLAKTWRGAVPQMVEDHAANEAADPGWYCAASRAIP